VVDPTGAGDVYAAALFVRMAAGRGLAAAMSFAAAAAAIAVEGAGVCRLPAAAEVLARLARHD
jgi:ribokinase